MAAVMVGISESPRGALLVRSAQRIAEAGRSPWSAVYVETPAYFKLGEAERQQITQTLQLAEQLGGEAVRVAGDSVARTLIDFARSHDATELILGEPSQGRWDILRRGSIVQEVILQSDRIDVHVVARDEEARPHPLQATRQHLTSVLKPYLASTLIVALLSLLAWILRSSLPLSNLSIIFLTAVLIAAVRWGLGPSIYTAILSVVQYNYFFVRPAFTFRVNSFPQDILTGLEFVAVAVITSNLTARVRAQAEAARAREQRTAALYALSQQLARAAGLESVQDVVVGQVAQILGGRAAVLLPDDGRLAIAAASPPEAVLEEHEQAAANWAWEHSQTSGHGTDTVPDSRWMFLPLNTTRGTVGVLGVYSAPGSHALFDERLLLEALAGQAAVAIERATLVQEMAETRLLAETDRLRAALLSSISHDLRTPLASIIGAASSLLSYSATYDESTRRELLETVQEEAERLDRFVGNLVSMTRLESGALRIKCAATEPKDLIGSARARVAPRLERRRVAVDVAPGTPMIYVDFVLMEQVLFNLLDNAIKYSGPESAIAISAFASGSMVTIEVADEGIGVPMEDLERIFDKFYRVNDGDSHGAGTGLGLSICRGIVEAHGGMIAARLRENGSGMVFVTQVPAANELSSDEQREVEVEWRAV